MSNRGRPGHSRRTISERLSSGTPMAAAANEYLEAIAVRGFSPFTIRGRSHALAFLVAWLAERGVDDPRQVTKPVLDRYQRALFYHRKADGAPLSFRSQVAYLVPVKALFKWLAQTNRILFNPASEIELPHIERRLPKVILNVAEVEAVLDLPDVDETLGLRDRAIMEVLYSTGMRRAELRALRLWHIDADRGVVTVEQGKGRRDRVVPIGTRALAWVDRYLTDARPGLVVPPDEGIVFLTIEGNDLTLDHLTTRIGRYIKTATGKAGSCHTFRHTMATLMLEGGADIRHIQEILGHVEVSSTQIYTHVSIEALKAVHARCHPGATNTRHRSPVAIGDRPAGNDGQSGVGDMQEMLAVLELEATEEHAAPHMSGAARRPASRPPSTPPAVEEDHHDQPRTHRRG